MNDRFSFQPNRFRANDRWIDAKESIKRRFDPNQTRLMHSLSAFEFSQTISYFII
jgi:hypothetical protein